MITRGTEPARCIALAPAHDSVIKDQADVVGSAAKTKAHAIEQP